MSSGFSPSDEPNNYHSNSRSMSSRVEHLTSALQDTNRNLKAVDKMLDDYKDMGEQQSSAMERLKDDLSRTTDALEDERRRRAQRAERRRRRGPTSPLRDYDRSGSDYEYERRRMRGGRHSPRDMHEIHQSLRDLTSEQLRMGEDMNREIDERRRHDAEGRRSVRDAVRGPIENVMSSVDRRLQNIQDELRSERQQLRKRQDEVGKISSQLKTALTTQKEEPSEGSELRMRTSQLEAQKSQYEAELEKLLRRLDQSEGGRDALLDQVEDLRRQLNRSEQDRNKLQLLLEQQKDVQGSRHAAEESWEIERRHLEGELRELRSQVGRSAEVIGEVTEVRRELERSEKQRSQLSDHIQVLNKEAEQHEKHHVTVTSQLQESRDSVTSLQAEKQRLLLQLEDTLKQLRDAGRVEERLSLDLRETRDFLDESEKKREEIKIKAQETVKQWKVKCKKLERDTDRAQHSAQVTSQRNEDVVKETETLRHQLTSSLQHADALKREVGELLAWRAHADETQGRRDAELNDLKALRIDLEKDLRDCKSVIDRLEHELRLGGEKCGGVYEEKLKLEDQLSALQSSQYMLQSQVHQMQKELSESGQGRVELSAQLAEVATERQDLKVQLSELKHSEESVRDQLQCLVKRLHEEKEFYTLNREAMRAELEGYKNRESQIVKDLTLRFKKKLAEYEAQVQAYKVELSESHSNKKLLRRQNEKLREEVETTNQKLHQVEDEAAEMEKKYLRIREDFVAKTHMTEDGMARAKEYELQFLDVKEQLLLLEKDYQNILHVVGGEVDTLVDVIALDASDSLRALRAVHRLPSEPQSWALEIKSKLEWARCELRSRRERELETRSNITMETSYNNSKLLPGNEMGRHERAEVMAERDIGSEGSVRNKGDAGGDAASRRCLETLRQENELLVTDLQTQQDTQQERERINERYVKLQETMNSLRQELQDTKNLSTILKDSSKTPTKQHNYNIHPSPTATTTTTEIPSNDVLRHDVIGNQRGPAPQNHDVITQRLVAEYRDDVSDDVNSDDATSDDVSADDVIGLTEDFSDRFLLDKPHARTEFEQVICY